MQDILIGSGKLMDNHTVKYSLPGEMLWHTCREANQLLSLGIGMSGYQCTVSCGYPSGQGDDSHRIDYQTGRSGCLVREAVYLLKHHRSVQTD